MENVTVAVVFWGGYEVEVFGGLNKKWTAIAKTR